MRISELTEIGHSSKSVAAGQRRTQWLNEPLANNQYVLQGYRVEFKPDGLYIYKGAELAYKKAGDYSEPKNKNLHGAKKLVTGLIAQTKNDPNDTQLFGKRDPEVLKQRRDHSKLRSKWFDQIRAYMSKHGVDMHTAHERVPFPTKL